MDRIPIGRGARTVHRLARYGNRPGMIAGEAGTGKPVALLVPRARREGDARVR